MQQVVENQLMQVAKVVEDQLDDQIHELENLGDEDIEKLRQRRIDAMKRQQAKRQQWLAKGHGECRTIMDEKEFFAEMKGEERMIVHFFRNNWPCKVMDKHMSELAAKHVETKFARIDAEKSPFLTERLKIWMLPTLALIKNEKTVDYVVGLDELGGSDDFKQEHLEMRLASAGVLNYDGEAAPPMPRAAGAQRKIRQTRQKDSSDEDSDFSD